MKSWILAIGVGTLLATMAEARAAPAPEAFQPNYVALDDVTLKSADGKQVATVKQGETVAARLTGDGNRERSYSPTDTLEVRTEDGRRGRAPVAAFNRLGSTIEVTDAARQVARSNNRFAFDLYRQTRQQEGNLFLSPASISTALAMTYAGAAGGTRSEMASVLHFDQQQEVHEGFSTMLSLLNSTGDRNGYRLRTANSLWAADDLQFQKTFLEVTADRYGALPQTLDFGQPDAARQVINAWVEEQTRNKIVNLIPPGVIETDTRLVLANAIHFEGGWSSKFNPNRTEDAPFRLSDGTEVQTPTMHQQRKFYYAEDDDTQVVSLAYRGGELAMIIALPKQVDGLAALESQLTNERFTNWLQAMNNNRPVQLYLPKFKLRSKFRLADALKSLGMVSAFTNQADFSALSSSEELMISEVVHQAFVEVDEKGTEAAAATAVVVEPTAAPAEPEQPPEPVVFRADHPFLFVIRDTRTHAILFMGRMEQP